MVYLEPRHGKAPIPRRRRWAGRACGSLVLLSGGRGWSKSVQKFAQDWIVSDENSLLDYRCIAFILTSARKEKEWKAKKNDWLQIRFSTNSSFCSYTRNIWQSRNFSQSSSVWWTSMVYLWGFECHRFISWITIRLFSFYVVFRTYSFSFQVLPIRMHLRA